ncbi:MAG: ATP-binding protein [Nocardioides sp.]
MTAESGGDQVEVLSLLDSAPDGVLVVDADGMVVWANRAAHEVFSPRGGSLVRRALGRPVLTGVPQRIEVIDSYGSFRSAEMVANEVPLGDGAMFVISLRDLTRFDEHQKQLKRKLDEQDEILSVVYDDASHNATSLLLIIDELLAGWDMMTDEERIGMVRLLSVKVEQLSDLLTSWTGGLLRDRSALLTDEFEPIDLLDAVTEGMSSWDRGTEDIEVVIEPGQMVHAIGSHVWSVLRELLDNAFTHGRPPVILAAHSRGDSTVIEVIDHGEGIGEEIKERLQLGFSQRSETGDRHTQGTGLWLARALVKAYGGSLHHQNVLGGGTRFVCSFPSRAVRLDA